MVAAGPSQATREGTFFKRLGRLLRRYGAVFTVIGALIGAVSLYVNNQLQRAELAETVLGHVYCELDNNIRDQLFTALSGEPVPFGPTPVYNLPRVEFWDAVTNGGTLQYITDPKLTFTLASAYADLKDLRQFVGAYRTELVNRTEPGVGLQLQDIITASSQRSKDRMLLAQDELRAWFEEQRGLSAALRTLWFWRRPVTLTRQDCIAGG